MDSYQRLVEGLPGRAASRSWRINERSVRDAVAALPLANPAQAGQGIEELLDRMSMVAASGAERANALEQLRGPLEDWCASVEQRIAGEAHPLSPGSTEAAELARRLHEKLFAAYAVALHELCAPAGKLPWLKAKLAAAVAVRALVQAGRVLVWSYRMYAAPPPGVWLRAHAVHAFADQLGVAGQVVPAGNHHDHPVSVRAAYSNILLLALSNPWRFNARELKHATEVVDCLAESCRVGPGGDAYVAIDAASDKGPGYVAEDRATAQGAEFGIDIAPAQQILGERLAQERSGVQAFELPHPGGLRIRTDTAFARHLSEGWTTATRACTRHAAGHRLDVVTGMHAVHHVLAGGLDFATFLRRLEGDAVTVGQDTQPAAWVVASDTVQPRIAAASVIDQSDSGYRLRLPASEGVRVRIGDLVALAPRPLEDEPRDWMVAILRWLRREPDGVVAGVELLARHARAAGVRAAAVDGARTSAAAERAVALDSERDARDVTLLTSAQVARVGQAVELALAVAASDWRHAPGIGAYLVTDVAVLSTACARSHLLAARGAEEAGAAVSQAAGTA